MQKKKHSVREKWIEKQIENSDREHLENVGSGMVGLNCKPKFEEKIEITYG